jgi:hypothetical protein
MFLNKIINIYQTIKKKRILILITKNLRNHLLFKKNKSK